MGVLRDLVSISWALTLLSRWLVPQYFLGFFTTSSIIFFSVIPIYITWWTVVYPRFFSPLRHMPEPPNRGFFSGHTLPVFRAATGEPAKEWIDAVPNNGLIRYSMWGKERLLVTQPSTISELLVTKNYHFTKPQELRNGVGRLLGVGILLAEGEEHKTQRKNLMPAFAYRA